MANKINNAELSESTYTHTHESNFQAHTIHALVCHIMQSNGNVFFHPDRLPYQLYLRHFNGFFNGFSIHRLISSQCGMHFDVMMDRT